MRFGIGAYRNSASLSRHSELRVLTRAQSQVVGQTTKICWNIAHSESGRCVAEAREDEFDHIQSRCFGFGR